MATTSALRLALFEPDIAQNVGTLLRLGACLGVPVDIIEPCGFPFGRKALARAGMDYIEQADCTVHASWADYQQQAHGRLVLISTRGTQSFAAFDFLPSDRLLFGAESAGVPDFVHAAADAVLRIPVRASCRSLNVAVSAAMVLSEALRQMHPDWRRLILGEKE